MIRQFLKSATLASSSLNWLSSSIYGAKPTPPNPPGPTPTPSTDTGCLLSFSDGSSIDISYDSTLNAIAYQATVMQSTYVSVGYGTTMTDINMVAWVADSGNSYQNDLWSTGHTDPTVIANDYTT